MMLSGSADTERNTVNPEKLKELLVDATRCVPQDVWDRRNALAQNDGACEVVSAVRTYFKQHSAQGQWIEREKELRSIEAKQRKQFDDFQKQLQELLSKVSAQDLLKAGAEESSPLIDLLSVTEDCELEDPKFYQLMSSAAVRGVTKELPGVKKVVSTCNKVVASKRNLSQRKEKLRATDGYDELERLRIRRDAVLEELGLTEPKWHSGSQQQKRGMKYEENVVSVVGRTRTILATGRRVRQGDFMGEIDLMFVESGEASGQDLILGECKRYVGDLVSCVSTLEAEVIPRALEKDMSLGEEINVCTYSSVGCRWFTPKDRPMWQLRSDLRQSVAQKFLRSVDPKLTFGTGSIEGHWEPQQLLGVDMLTQVSDEACRLSEALACFDENWEVKLISNADDEEAVYEYRRRRCV